MRASWLLLTPLLSDSLQSSTQPAGVPAAICVECLHARAPDTKDMGDQDLSYKVLFLCGRFWNRPC